MFCKRIKKEGSMQEEEDDPRIQRVKRELSSPRLVCDCVAVLSKINSLAYFPSVLLHVIAWYAWDEAMLQAGDLVDCEDTTKRVYLAVVCSRIFPPAKTLLGQSNHPNVNEFLPTHYLGWSTWYDEFVGVGSGGTGGTRRLFPASQVPRVLVGEKQEFKYVLTGNTVTFTSSNSGRGSSSSSSSSSTIFQDVVTWVRVAGAAPSTEDVVIQIQAISSGYSPKGQGQQNWVMVTTDTFFEAKRFTAHEKGFVVMATGADETTTKANTYVRMGLAHHQPGHLSWRS